MIGRTLGRILSPLPGMDRIVNKKIDTHSDEVLVFCDFSVAGLKPCKSSRMGSALNKAGRLVLKGSCNRQQVKIYQAACPEHASFIAAVSSHAEIRELFPEVLAIKERFILCEWVAGSRKTNPANEDLAALQSRLHHTSIAGLPVAGYDYWHDFIKPRFLLAAELAGEQALAGEAARKVENVWSSHRQFLMHPDLTCSNMVMSLSGSWKVIDNELLSTGGLPLLDVCNTAHSMNADQAQLYASAYFARNRKELSHNDLELLSAAWLGRIAGASFVSGNLPRVKKVFRKYRSGQSILPFRMQRSSGI